jgi:hypothetical protein
MVHSTEDRISGGSEFIYSHLKTKLVRTASLKKNVLHSACSHFHKSKLTIETLKIHQVSNASLKNPTSQYLLPSTSRFLQVFKAKYLFAYLA